MEPFQPFCKVQRLQRLKFTWREPSKGEDEKSKFPRKEPPADMESSHHSLVGTERGLSAEASRGTLQAPQEAEEETSDGIMSCFAEEDANALVHSVLGECSDEAIRPQQQQQQLNSKHLQLISLRRLTRFSGMYGAYSLKRRAWRLEAEAAELLRQEGQKGVTVQVAAFATKQLIDIFLLEHSIGKMSFPGPRFFEKEHSSMVLDSLMFDILLGQFFSIQQWQRTTFENIPLRDFHLRAFTEVALDVILTELNKLTVENMEDLLEYERGVQEQEQKDYQKLQKAE
uniref:Uncharacterized protein n=1 Tax=Sphaerodactylus townsendi TaxID=933632 RepID=A0ACB8EYA6_9SAUR